jgi:hypothetical protein
MMKPHLAASTIFVAVLVACAGPVVEESEEPDVQRPKEPTITQTPTEQPSSTPEPSPTETAPAATATSPATRQTTGTPVFLTAGISLDIGVIGSDRFVSQAERALNLLASCAPEVLREVDNLIEVIQESDRSGMLVDHGVFLASDVTAFAPGYSEMPQVFWFAGSIVHDAHHRTQSQQGRTLNWDALTLEEREAIEAEAREVQIEALEMCGDDLPAATEREWSFMLKYLTDMQAGITECDYCKVEWENRNW